ncbi:MAG: hypothetical protein C4554_03825 [Dethiobacter sp.]|nr:MAG: hypothetical protein C4554_03825 [Dethiobacter sp.]
MKVLLSFVGEQDPYSDKTGEEGAIITLCRHLRPEVIYLFPTAKGFGIKSETQSRALDTEIWIKSEIDKKTQVFINPMHLSDPTDYPAILPATRRLVDKIMRDLSDVDCDFHLNCSSGTPQLKSAWLILANAGLFKNCQLWQVANPQFKKEDRVSILEVTFLEEENLLSRIKRYSEEFLFQRMAEECYRLKDISLYSFRKDKAGLLYRIFQAYQSWDLICYDDAYKRLNSVYNEIRTSADLAELAKILEAQVQILAKLKDNSALENKYNLVDLYMNARRRLKRSDYTDTLSRFWRIYEGILYSHLRNAYKIESSNLVESTNKDRIREIVGYFHPGINKISIKKAEAILSNVFKDKIYCGLGDRYLSAKRNLSSQSIKLSDLLEELRNKRNKSIVAHGMKPVAEDDAINCVKAIEVVIKEFIPSAAMLIEKYPLGLVEIKKVIDVLDKAFTL